MSVFMIPIRLPAHACLAVICTLSTLSTCVANPCPQQPTDGKLSPASSKEPTEVNVSEATPNDVAKFFEREQKQVLTFMGFSGAGYENEEKVLGQARDILKSYSPEKTIVNIGATAEGIGKVYEIAKSMGFKTTGIVSTQAKKYDAALSEHVDVVFYIEDETWGGFQDDLETLSPTSQAMVQSSDSIVAFGGGEVSRDEMIAAKRMGKSVQFVAAEMNRAAAIKKAKDKGQPAPTDFYGAAHAIFAQ